MSAKHKYNLLRMIQEHYEELNHMEEERFTQTEVIDITASDRRAARLERIQVQLVALKRLLTSDVNARIHVALWKANSADDLRRPLWLNSACALQRFIDVVQDTY